MSRLNCKCDFLVVGSGIAGSVIAERLASQLNKRVIIVEKRDHVGGNLYDFYNDDGILIHKYGPHIFHTNHDNVWKYLSDFAEWNDFQLRVLACVDGRKLPFPINLDTVNILLNKNFSESELKKYFKSVRVRSKRIKNAKDEVTSRIGDFLYEKFYKNYSFKQWGISAEDLLPSVTRRIPIRYDNDGRYFSDRYQGLPKDGYSKLIENILNNNKITVILNTDYKQIINDIRFDYLIYTGAIDYFFDYKFGELPYRSLRFEYETFNIEYFQEVAIINYPNDFSYTRTTEFKHMTLQGHPKTVIMKEYPTEEGDPYYPMPTKDAIGLYNKYKNEAKKLHSVYFIGRLAEYKYYNIDQVVKSALKLFKKIRMAKP